MWAFLFLNGTFKTIFSPLGYMGSYGSSFIFCFYDDVIKWNHFPRYWPFMRGIHWSPVKSPHKGQRRGALMFFFICAWIERWVNNREAGDLRRHRAHYDVIVMLENASYRHKVTIAKFECGYGLYAAHLSAIRAVSAHGDPTYDQITPILVAVILTKYKWI